MTQTPFSPIPAHGPVRPGSAYPLILQCLDYTVDLMPAGEHVPGGGIAGADRSGPAAALPAEVHLEAVAMAEAAVESAEWELDRARHEREQALLAARLAGALDHGDTVP